MNAQRALALALEQEGLFFKVVFRRRTSKPGAPAGSLRTMYCRRHVSQFVLGNPHATSNSGETRFEQDIRNNCLTVFDIQAFKGELKAIREATRREPTEAERLEAGRRCYRRIALDGVIEIAGVQLQEEQEQELIHNEE